MKQRHVTLFTVSEYNHAWFTVKRSAAVKLLCYWRWPYKLGNVKQNRPTPISELTRQTTANNIKELLPLNKIQFLLGNNTLMNISNLFFFLFFKVCSINTEHASKSHTNHRRGRTSFLISSCCQSSDDQRRKKKHPTVLRPLGNIFGSIRQSLLHGEVCALWDRWA